MTTLGIRLPDDVQKGLDHICTLTKRSKSSVVREALEQYIEDTLDYHRALERLEQHKRDGGKTYTLAEARKILESDAPID